MQYILFLFLFLISFLTEGDNSEQQNEGDKKDEPTTEEIREEIEEQRELTYATLEYVEQRTIDINGSIAELREYIDRTVAELTARIEGLNAANGNSGTTETQTTIQDTEPESTHWWFRRFRR